ncbi:MAG: TAXI family TRAP transporter solute-binding subunit [Peptococcaceae bacterium]|jgi:TRAP transporter TAXI family solute receptor|nr:TAXI family TRAP transporter solute-binding subunit [Peptococcaceae bacterium]
MKKILSVSLLLLLVLSLLAGCGSTSGGGSGGGTTQTGGDAKRLLMVTGGTSGTYYAYGGVIASTLTEKLPNIEITANTSGASAANARALKNKEAELAILQNDVLDYAYHGTVVMADDGEMPMLRTIATLYPEVIQVVATKSSGIKSVADLKGKRVCVGDAGSGTEANARQVLEAFGITFADLGKVENLSFGDSATAMQNGTIDASFTTAGVPNPAITELNNAIDIVILPVGGAEADKLIATYPFYSKFKINDSDYGIPGADTVAILATMACTDGLDENTVYAITKGLFDNQAALAAAHAKGKELSPENAIKGASIPFHPGAVKYYKEVGVLN